MLEDVCATGEDLASESSDNMSDKCKTRHHLLNHKLTLDEETSSGKAGAEGGVTKLRDKKRAGSKPSDCKHTSDISDG